MSLPQQVYISTRKSTSHWLSYRLKCIFKNIGRKSTPQYWTSSPYPKVGRQVAIVRPLSQVARGALGMEKHQPKPSRLAKLARATDVVGRARSTCAITFTPSLTSRIPATTTPSGSSSGADCAPPSAGRTRQIVRAVAVDLPHFIKEVSCLGSVTFSIRVRVLGPPLRVRGRYARPPLSGKHAVAQR